MAYAFGLELDHQTELELKEFESQALEMA
jgi:hypothetical protein